MRNTKTVNGVTTQYYYDDSGRLICLKNATDELWLYYDLGTSPTSMRHNGTRYLFLKNIQGDVTAIVNSAGTVMARYTYDSWGTVLSITDGNGNNIVNNPNHIGNINPIRYRGYYYDTESSLYYLNTRYYDPDTGRFINADGQLNQAEGFTGMNLFQYCGNNPVNRMDPNGEAWWHWALGAAVVVGFAALTVATAGGFAAAATAVAAVGSGVAAATTASTVAAAGFIASATYLGMSAMDAASNSKSISDFSAQGSWETVAGTVVAGVMGSGTAYVDCKTSNPSSSKYGKSSSIPTSKPKHSIGVVSPKKISNPGGSYTKLDNNGNIYSYTQYDSIGRQSMRIDFKGRPHAGVLPHTHVYLYPERGGRVEYVFDLNWNQIN